MPQWYKCPNVNSDYMQAICYQCVIYIYIHRHQIQTEFLRIQSENYLNFLKFLLQITFSKVIIYSSCIQRLIYKKSEEQLHIHYIDES